MNELIFSVEESVDGGYEARALGVSIYTEVENLEDLKKEIRDAVQCYFETEEMPRVIWLHFIKEEVINIWESPGTLAGIKSFANS